MSRRPLKVLMTADAVGGVWTYALTLARAMQPYDVSFTMATMGPRPAPDQLSEAATIPNLRLEVSDYTLEWMSDPWADVDAAAEWLRALEARDEPDLVHLNGYAHAASGFEAPSLIVGHSCCLSWWRSLKNTAPPACWDEYRRRVSLGLESADVLVAPTAAVLTEYQRLYPRLPRAHVIHNAVPPPRACGPTKRPVVLAAGRAWDEAKNITAVAKAAPLIPWAVELAGDTHGPVGSKPLPNTVRALGRLTSGQMHATLTRAAIYVHPARYEPFGLLPLEAAQHSCALVLSDIPTMRELWHDAAIFFDPQNPTALARAVNQLINAPDLLVKYAALARQRARHYSVARFAAAYAHLYSRLTREASHGTRPCASRSSTTPC